MCVNFSHKVAVDKLAADGLTVNKFAVDELLGSNICEQLHTCTDLTYVRVNLAHELTVHGCLVDELIGWYIDACWRV